MRSIVLMFIAFAALAGCERRTDPKTATETVTAVLGPDQYGVVCYLEVGPSNRTLSCVKVN